MSTDFAALADQQLAGGTLTTDQALAILRSRDEELLDLVAAGARLRRSHFGRLVKVNYLVNLKSGLCPEDCGYCSQRVGSEAPILKYSWLKPDQAVDQASHGIQGGASRVCLVASGRGPSNRDIERVGDIVGKIKADHPQVEVCACLGLLKTGQADALREAGVDAYNHNINTSESRYEEICSTHTYADRVETIDAAKHSGMSACSGLIVGMGESDEEIVEAIFALRALDSDSIPVNFLMPFEGTPLGQDWNLTPQRAMRILALARFACPDREVRMAGGREMHLRTLQPLALHLANSLFLGDYLTSQGQAAQDDLAMIADGGWQIVGQVPGDATAEAGLTHPVIRERGAGTAVTANA
ncbi:MAG TPA: biotin synthase BioB [Tetrasphaera sp.]|uniref:biotin synthase BioB n=1 Tax=Nostocoides sp. TaxID=1917966 RepID=UPI002CE2D4DF|nr:biotin synthase BioB [Tetrasphaera sp.]HNQ07416.1 biotin synthase BioB [Tetrasphaera sp.]